MKKSLFLILFLTAATFSLSAQEMRKGSSILNLGAGIFPGIGINASFDYGLVDSWGPGLFTVGAFAGFNTWTNNFTGFYATSNSAYREFLWAAAPRATYQYSFTPSFEAYATAMLGIAAYTYSSDYFRSSAHLFFGGTLGCRYSFTPSFSVFAETGYNTAFLTAGVSLSF